MEDFRKFDWFQCVQVLQRTSSDVSLIERPIDKPLLSRLWCVSCRIVLAILSKILRELGLQTDTAFGAPVVPLYRREINCRVRVRQADQDIPRKLKIYHVVHIHRFPKSLYDPILKAFFLPDEQLTEVHGTRHMINNLLKGRRIVHVIHNNKIPQCRQFFNFNLAWTKRA